MTAVPHLRIAVVIPYYNGSKFIERALASVYRQTLPAYEIIVVDDGSTTDERTFVTNLAADGKFTLLHKTNGGQGSARNAGVDLATAEYICFLDQDDFYLDHHNAALAAAIPVNANRFGWVYGEVQEADGEGNICRTAIVKAYSATPKTNIYNLLAHDMYILPSASLISKAAFVAIGGFDEQFTGYEDDDLFLRLFRAGYTNTFVDNAVVVWCINTESTSFSLRMSTSRHRYFEKLRNNFRDNDVRGIHIMRDCLVPRFDRSFVDEARRAILTNASDVETKIAIFESYKAVVLATASVSVAYKRRLTLIAHVFSTRSPRLIKVAGRLFHYKLKTKHQT